MTLFSEHYGQAALFAPDCAPRPGSSLLPCYLHHTFKTAPALPRPSAASALPRRGGSLASRLRTPTGRARKGKQTRLSSGLELTVPGPGAGFLLQAIALATPFRQRLPQPGTKEELGGFPLYLWVISVCRGGVWGVQPDEAPARLQVAERPRPGRGRAGNRRGRARARGRPSLT